jgi:hypothetical protein
MSTDEMLDRRPLAFSEAEETELGRFWRPAFPLATDFGAFPMALAAAASLALAASSQGGRGAAGAPEEEPLRRKRSRIAPSLSSRASPGTFAPDLALDLDERSFFNGGRVIAPGAVVAVVVAAVAVVGIGRFFPVSEEETEKVMEVGGTGGDTCLSETAASSVESLRTGEIGLAIGAASMRVTVGATGSGNASSSSVDERENEVGVRSLDDTEGLASTISAGPEVAPAPPAPASAPPMVAPSATLLWRASVVAAIAVAASAVAASAVAGEAADLPVGESGPSAMPCAAAEGEKGAPPREGEATAGVTAPEAAGDRG